jgi:DNA (cytosine-5)-methyltransferase 1
MKQPTRKNTTKKEDLQPLRVVELFAGVGGFRLGLSGKNERRSHDFKTVWFNQWEPGTKKQHAHDVYKERFGDTDEETHLTNVDIAAVVRMAQTGEFKIPNHDVLVGGFPCQDYSVARTLSQAKGIAGKKGVLWWEIRNILELKIKTGRPVKYLFLENVDRLLKSPSKQRGRDFAIILATLWDLGYAVEWRVINAADYGMPQRRRRTFIVGYHRNTDIYSDAVTSPTEEWILKNGVIASAFPAERKDGNVTGIELKGTYSDITDSFNTDKSDVTPFGNAGMMHNRMFYSFNVTPKYAGKRITLADILLPEREVPSEYFIKENDLKKWKYLKGAKNEKRKAANGYIFTYTEGPMAFPDSLDKPSRTIITGEGGSTPSRFKHVIKTKKGYRRLTPIELERLSMFPDHHTELEGIGDVRRAFFMGNALVVGVIEKIGKSLIEKHRKNGAPKRVLSATSNSSSNGTRAKRTLATQRV